MVVEQLSTAAAQLFALTVSAMTAFTCVPAVSLEPMELPRLPSLVSTASELATNSDLAPSASGSEQAACLV